MAVSIEARVPLLDQRIFRVCPELATTHEDPPGEDQGGSIQEHLDGGANHIYRLWSLIVFELWQGKLLSS